MKNIKEISIRWIRNTVVFFIVRYIIELIYPTITSEHKIEWVAIEAILFGIIMVAIGQFMSYRKNKNSCKTSNKDE